MNSSEESPPLPASARSAQGVVGFVWIGILVVAGIGLTWLTFHSKISLVDAGLPFVVVFMTVALIAFLGEYTDSSIGMGFGTVLTPVLLILGFTPLQVVPCLLLSETLTGLVGGVLHHGFGNVDLRWGTHANRSMLVLAGFSVVGTVAAVFLAVNLPAFAVKLYIAVMIIAISGFLLFGRGRGAAFSVGKMIILGIVAAFNKGISGGGYGPLITGGQVLFGVPEKSAIGTTTFTEGLVCLVSFALYLVLQHGGLDWGLALPVLLGGLVSVPAATWTVRVLPASALRPAMGGVTLFLGCLLLINVLR